MACGGSGEYMCMYIYIYIHTFYNIYCLLLAILGQWKKNHLNIHRAVHTIVIIIITIIIKSFLSLWTIVHQWRAPTQCGLQLSPWHRSTIFLCSLSHPPLPFATFSSAYLSFYIAEDSNPMQFSLLLPFLYVMCVQSSSIFFLLPDFLFNSDGLFSTVLRS